jgi:hypothetical protein
MPFEETGALMFDAFGTVVDWHTSVACEAARIGRKAGIDADGGALADRWRAEYQPSMAHSRSGKLPCGAARVPDTSTDLSVDITASDFNNLADHLGA